MEMIWLAAKIAYGVFALLTWAGFITWTSYKAINKHRWDDSSSMTWGWPDVVRLGGLVGGMGSIFWPVIWFFGACVGCAYFVNKLLKEPQPSQVL